MENAAGFGGAVYGGSPKSLSVDARKNFPLAMQRRTIMDAWKDATISRNSRVGRT